MSEVDRQNLTMQQLSADCEAKLAQLDSLTARLQQSQLTLEEQRSEASRKQKELQEKLDEANATCVRFETMNNLKCDEQLGFEREIDRLERQHDEDRLAQSDRMSALQERVTEAEAEVLRWEAERVEQCSETEQPRRQVNERTHAETAELERVQNESLDLVRERDRMKDEMTTLGNSCRDKSDEIDRLNHHLTANSAMLHEQLSRLQNESLELVRERDRMKDEMTTLENSCRDKSDEIDRLNHQLERFNVEMTANSARLQAERSEQNGLVESLRVELDSAREDRNQTETRYNDSLKQIETFKTEHDKVKKSHF